MNIAVMVSGGGTNLQALIDAQQRGEISPGKITLVVASKKNCYALERAKENSIKTAVLRRRDFDSDEALDLQMLKVMQENNIEVIALAGYLSKLGDNVLSMYANKIINVHPSLIPSFCGQGFYGLKVHQAALEYGVKVTGATVHLVNEVYDSGKIILQKAVEVLPQDTPETLQQRVMQQAEWVIFPKALAMLCRGEI